MKALKCLLSAILGIFLLSSCNNETNPGATSHTLTNSQTMHSYISIFEIPASDLARAIHFYQAILDIKIEKMEVNGMLMGIWPYENQQVTGIIIQSKGYKPSASGVTVYLNGGDNLQTILDKVEKNGGKIVTPKTPHADGVGFWAHFLDSEGNKLGLNSPH